MAETTAAAAEGEPRLPRAHEVRISGALVVEKPAAVRRRGGVAFSRRWRTVCDSRDLAASFEEEVVVVEPEQLDAILADPLLDHQERAVTEELEDERPEETLEELRARVRELTGKDPHPRAKAETLRERIAEAEAKAKTEGKKEG